MYLFIFKSVTIFLQAAVLYEFKRITLPDHLRELSKILALTVQLSHG